jgi:hypothetical protein
LSAVRETPERGHKVLGWLVLALARQRLGQTDEANKWLKQAAAEMEQQAGDRKAAAGESLPHGRDWGDFLLCQLLQREAETLLKAGKP